LPYAGLGTGGDVPDQRGVRVDWQLRGGGQETLLAADGGPLSESGAESGAVSSRNACCGPEPNPESAEIAAPYHALPYCADQKYLRGVEQCDNSYVNPQKVGSGDAETGARNAAGATDARLATVIRFGPDYQIQ